MHADLNGKVVLVTGANGVVGGAVARLLAKEGAILALQYFSNAEGALALGQETSGLPIYADLRCEPDVRALFLQIQRQLGPLFGCVAAAGTRPFNETRFQDLSVEDWEVHCDQNLLMTFLTAREFCRAANYVDEASLILMGASSGEWGNPGRAPFAAAKSAIAFGFLQSITDELANVCTRGRVNVVIPGAIYSGDEINVHREELAHARQAGALNAPTPTDVAHTIIWLLSSRLSTAVTGQQFKVDGGRIGRLRR